MLATFRCAAERPEIDKMPNFGVLRVVFEPCEPELRDFSRSSLSKQLCFPLSVTAHPLARWLLHAACEPQMSIEGLAPPTTLGSY